MRLSHTPDEYLMGQVARGKREHLDILVRRYASPLLTFITRMTGSSHLAEDVFQDVFLILWKKRRQFKEDYPFKPWLYRIAVNKCRENHRIKTIPISHSCPDGNSQVAESDDPLPSEIAIAAETSVMINEAVATLPEKQRTVLVLRVWSKLRYSEIAEILGRSEGTVRSNMHHALAALRVYLEPRMN